MTTRYLEVPNDEIRAWAKPFPQTWTLFDMLMSLESGKLYLLMYRLGQAKVALKPQVDEGEDVDVVKHLLKFVGQDVRFLPVSNSLKLQAKRLDDRLGKLTESDQLPPLAELVDELIHNLTNELSEDLHLQIGAEDKAIFLEPWEWFGKATMDAFPGLTRDIRDCTRFLVLNQWTASVYHAMVIFQHGMYWLADELELEFKKSVELENWNTIIERAQSEIQKLGKKEKTPEERTRLAFYSDIASHLFHVKDAWRNFVAHGRAQYDEDQARRIVDNVRSFMGAIAKDIRGTPQRTPPPPL